MQVSPARAYFRPDETIRLKVGFDRPMTGPVRASVTHLGEPVATWRAESAGSTVIIEGRVPPVSGRGYLVEVTAGDQTAHTAFDVLDSWTQAPRYGYLTDFSLDRPASDVDATLDFLLTVHVNGIQFYDWQYRHATLLPPQDAYVDPLGRPLSLKSIAALIEASHERGIAAMPYTAIYGASNEFAAEHPDWAMRDADGKVTDFHGFLKYMNVQSAGWRAHFIRECAAVVAALPFDGVHVDQYGEPFTGFDANGQPLDLPQGFADTMTALREAVPADKAVLFNLVHNWPNEKMASTPLDFWYSELWPPMTDLNDVWRAIRHNRRLNPRPAVIALYIPPEREATVTAVHATILASGATHIAHGDHATYLSDPYFPLAGTPSPRLAARLREMADFTVAYEEALVFATDVTDEWAGRVLLDGQPVTPGRVIVRQSGDRVYVNLLGASGKWDTELPPVTPRSKLKLTVPEGWMPRWWATPETPATHALDSLDLPLLGEWLLLCFDLKEPSHA
jgi:dextranase